MEEMNNKRVTLSWFRNTTHPPSQPAGPGMAARHACVVGHGLPHTPRLPLSLPLPCPSPQARPHAELRCAAAAGGSPRPPPPAPAPDSLTDALSLSADPQARKVGSVAE